MFPIRPLVLTPTIYHSYSIVSQPELNTSTAYSGDINPMVVHIIVLPPSDQSRTQSTKKNVLHRKSISPNHGYPGNCSFRLKTTSHRFHVHFTLLLSVILQNRNKRPEYSLRITCILKKIRPFKIPFRKSRYVRVRHEVNLA